MTWEIHNVDCLDFLRTLPDGSVDAVVTDPPYCSGGSLEAQKNTKAQGLRGATVASPDFKWFSADNMSTPGLVWLLRSLLSECRRVLKPNRSALLFTDWRMVPSLAPALESSGLRYRNMIVWDKGNAGLGVGFKPAYEVILEFSNGSTEYQTRTGQNLIRGKRVPSSAKEHGCQKPVDLIEELVGVVCPQDGTVLDPFAGSGTTGVACIQTGRNFIGTEIDAGYCEIARRRCADAEASIALLAQAKGQDPNPSGPTCESGGSSRTSVRGSRRSRSNLQIDTPMCSGLPLASSSGKGSHG